MIEKIAAKYGNSLPKLQNAESTFSKVLPKVLTQQHDGKELPAISRITKWSGLYNKAELKSYFELLTNSFIMNSLESPVVFMLNSGNHSITVSYDPSLYSWRIIDANQLTLVDKPTINLDEIADWVMKAFPNLGNVPFATEIFCHKNATEQTLACFNACQKDPVWKKIHQVTKEKAKLTDWFGHSWLRIAAKEGFLDVVKALVQQQADVNQQTKEGGTALIAAAQEDKVEIAKFLLENKAEVNHCAAMVKDGTTPLLSAVSHNNAEIVKLLLEFKADVNQSNTSQATPVLIAAQNGHIASLKLLFDKKPDLDKRKGKDGYTPLIMAAQNGHVKVVKAFVNESKERINQTNAAGETPLFKAAQQGHVETVRLLLARKALIDSAIQDGSTPLLIALRRDHIDVAKLLLQSGADVNQSDVCGVTPITLVILSTENKDLVKLLLESGADIYQSHKAPGASLPSNALDYYSEIKNTELAELLEPYNFINQIKKTNYNQRAISKLKSIRLKNDNLKNSVQNYKELSDYVTSLIVLMEKYKNNSSSNIEQKKIITDLDKVIKRGFKKFAVALDFQMERASIEKLKNDAQSILSADHSKVSLGTALESYGLFNNLATAGITKLPSGNIAKWPFNNANGKPSTELRATEGSHT